MKTQEPPAHKVRRNAVRSIEQKVSRLKNMQNTSNELQKLNINELPLELDSDGYPDFHGCFFKPLENIALCPDDDECLEEFSVFDDPDEEDMRPIDWAEEISNYILSYVMAAADVGYWPQQPDSNDINLSEFEGIKPFWYATAVSRSIPGEPQYKCMMASNIDIGEDDRLTRFELLCICRIMVKRLNWKRYVEHMITPVLIISCMAPRQARILHAHYDGVNLVVRKSKLYDLRPQDNEILMLLIRWWCSHSVGDTMSA